MLRGLCKQMSIWCGFINDSEMFIEHAYCDLAHCWSPVAPLQCWLCSVECGTDKQSRTVPFHINRGGMGQYCRAVGVFDCNIEQRFPIVSIYEFLSK